LHFIGIDPGVSGGIAVLAESGAVVETHKMPATERDILDIFEALRVPYGVVGARALLERVSASPQMGVVSAFTFGRGVGRLEMALTAARIAFDYITFGKWQQIMCCRTGGDKNISKRRAQQLFPSLTITHAIADALLLAECCRRMERANVKEESRRAQAGTEAPGREGVVDVLEEFVGRGQRAQTAAQAAIAAATRPPARPAVAAAPRARAGSQQPARQHLRGRR